MRDMESVIAIQEIEINRARLVAARGQLSLREAAEKLGTSKQNLHLMETGQRRIPDAVLSQMLKVYKVSLSYLQSGA